MQNTKFSEPQKPNRKTLSVNGKRQGHPLCDLQTFPSRTVVFDMLKNDSLLPDIGSKVRSRFLERRLHPLVRKKSGKRFRHRAVANRVRGIGDWEGNSGSRVFVDLLSQARAPAYHIDMCDEIAALED